MDKIFWFLGDCTYKFCTTFTGKLLVYLNFALVNICVSCVRDNLGCAEKVVLFLGEFAVLVGIELMSVIKNNLERQQK